MRRGVVVMLDFVAIHTGLFLAQPTLPTGAEESTTLRIATLLNKFRALSSRSFVALFH